MKSNPLLRIVAAAVLSVVMALSASYSHAQNVSLLDKMCDNLAKSCVEMKCTWSARMSGVTTNGSGELKIQGDMWTLVGNGVEMWCDGKSLWIVDPSLKEVMIEPVEEDVEVKYLTNPALAFVHLHELFAVGISRQTEDGEAMFYSMKPKEGSDIDYLNVEVLSSDASIRRGSVAFKSGDIIKIEVSSMKLTPEVSVEAFSPRNVFDSSWIVSDLR